MFAELTARNEPAHAVPLIDLSGAATALVTRLRDACLDRGFFYLANHGVPAELSDAALLQTRRFFALPLRDKLAVDRSLSSCRRGYEPIGGQVLQQGTRPDYKEAFDLGAEHLVRLLHYPPQPADGERAQQGAGAHTDWGAITLLWQDGVGGLQVFDQALGWIERYQSAFARGASDG